MVLPSESFPIFV